MPRPVTASQVLAELPLKLLLEVVKSRDAVAQNLKRDGTEMSPEAARLRLKATIHLFNEYAKFCGERRVTCTLNMSDLEHWVALWADVTLTHTQLQRGPKPHTLNVDEIREHADAQISDEALNTKPRIPNPKQRNFGSTWTHRAATRASWAGRGRAR